MRAWLLLVVVVLSSCEGWLEAGQDAGLVEDAGTADADGGSIVVPDEELVVFQREVWSLARAECLACHRDVRAFASDDVRVAWGVALQLVRFELPAESTLAIRSENLHCGTAACGPGADRRARFAEGIRLWGLARGQSDAGTPELDGGTSSDAGQQPEPDYTAFLACDRAALPAAETAQRIPKSWYVNTVLEAFREQPMLAFTSRSGVLHERAWSGTLVSAVAQLPEDGESEHLAREDARLTDTHLEGMLAVAQGVVDYYANAPARLGALNACLTAATPNEACIRSFTVELLGRRLLSRPLDTDEVDEWYARYVAAPGSPQERVLELLRAFLLHPELVFGLAWKGPVDLDAGVQSLTSYEFARKLAWHYTEAPPSPALFADAQSGALLTTTSTLEAHLAAWTANNANSSYVFPLSAHHFTFYSFLEQWLDAKSFRGFPSGAQGAAAFPGFSFQAGNENWYGEAQNEIYSYGFRQMFVDRGTYAAFFTDTRGEVGSFTQRLYSPAPVNGDLGPNRPGVLSRVGFLASGDVYPNQIIFGVRVMRNVLCQPLAPPDPALLPANFRDLGRRDAHPDWTTRRFTAEQTSAQSCQACHVRINALGATISRFDGAGRFDSNTGTEKVFANQL
ncbi:MAG: DUF1588 domain-containing protein, partial [Archangium sp.]|nr:DUF1588 domain-containing protein [Archangium sp.]